ncbi:MAG: phosphate signaling complex protein PhoU [Oligosphaeraceae bacterium]|nr:phosphate signaling complex protein PhoU [Oligosphaeraceae bacterium]
MTRHFTNALSNLQSMLGTMSAYAEGALRLSGKAVAELSRSIATEVIAGDTKLDTMEIQIEEECLKILALHQPVASDLRQVITILKINNELERIGDLAVNMAELVENLDSFSDSSIEKMDFSEMLQAACGMVKDALDSLAYHNVTLAQEVIARDEKVDTIHSDNHGVVRDLILKYPAYTQYYLNGLIISRCLERVADIATNIAEDVIYLESGRIVRHRHNMENSNAS